tara:strand:- start:384 stop:650 length:267 start_codon:yes stop_codon:yes gene_type:complete
MNFTKKAINFYKNKNKFVKCSYGKKENNFFCSFAKFDKNNHLICKAMLNLVDDMRVKGLNKCFLTARNEYKFSIVNKRKKQYLKNNKS